MIQQQRQVEQDEEIDALDIVEVQGGFSFCYVFPYVHLSHHLQNHREAGMMDRGGGGRKGKW